MLEQSVAILLGKKAQNLDHVHFFVCDHIMFLRDKYILYFKFIFLLHCHVNVYFIVNTE